MKMKTCHVKNKTKISGISTARLRNELDNVDKTIGLVYVYVYLLHLSMFFIFFFFLSR